MIEMTHDTPDALRGFPVIVETPVAWAEMDVFHHVNNTVFFRYFENARIAYLDRIGFDGADEEHGIGPILHSTQARFRRPVIYPDRLQVGARTRELREDRFVMEYRVVSEEQGGVAAEGGGIVVAFDYRSRSKAVLPDDVRQRIERLEGRSFAEPNPSPDAG
jgi:acyl-CoA thioester hydrolase